MPELLASLEALAMLRFSTGLDNSMFLSRPVTELMLPAIGWDLKCSRINLGATLAVQAVLAHPEVVLEMLHVASEAVSLLGSG